MFLFTPDGCITDKCKLTVHGQEGKTPVFSVKNVTGRNVGLGQPNMQAFWVVCPVNTDSSCMAWIEGAHGMLGLRQDLPRPEHGTYARGFHSPLTQLLSTKLYDGSNKISHAQHQKCAPMAGLYIAVRLGRPLSFITAPCT